MSIQTEAATIADAALDDLGCANECLAWLDALSWAIGSALKSGMYDRAAELAGAAQYLACDIRNTTSQQARDLNSQLDALEARGGDE